MLDVRVGGGQKPHGIVTFKTEEAIDKLMARRPHLLDGQEVTLHRAAPDSSSMKKDFRIQNLTVVAENNQALAQPDIKRFFSKFGKTVEMDLTEKDGSAWIVYFDE